MAFVWFVSKGSTLATAFGNNFLEFDYVELNTIICRKKHYMTLLNSLFCCFLAGLLMLQLVQKLMFPCRVAAHASVGSETDRYR